MNKQELVKLMIFLQENTNYVYILHDHVKFVIHSVNGNKWL